MEMLLKSAFLKTAATNEGKYFAAPARQILMQPMTGDMFSGVEGLLVSC